MTVAVVTVKFQEVSGLNDFVELDEPLYGLVYFWLMFSAAGRISLDHLIRSALGRATEVTRAHEMSPHRHRLRAEAEIDSEPGR